MSDDEFRPKRRRVRSPSPPKQDDDDDDNYVPYVPVAKRREEKFAKLQSWGVRAGRERPKKPQDDAEEKEQELKEEEQRREKARRERTLLLEAQEVHKKKAVEGELRQQSRR
jgi:ATP-dependent RNA helicase DDX41